jgi:polar amino acid transport system substrate-binding protein
LTDACSSDAIDIGFILDGAFQTASVAIAVQKDRPAALAFVKDFVESAKANGIVRRAFDDAGLNGLSVAP